MQKVFKFLHQGVLESFFLKRKIFLSVAKKYMTGALFFDISAAFLSLPFSLFLRLGVSISEYGWPTIFREAIGFSCVAIGVFIWTESHKGIWRYTSLKDLARLVKTVILSEIFFIPYLLISQDFWFFPSTVFLIQPIVLGAVLGGSRVLYRVYQEIQEERADHAPLLRAILVGVGPQTDLFLRELARQKNPAYEVLGILDPKGTQLNRHIHGLEILGQITQLENVVAQLINQRKIPDVLVLTDPEVRGKKLNTLSRRARILGMEIGQWPQAGSLSSGSSRMVKPLSIENLLGRPQASLDRESMFHLIKGKKILITGVGGSIGGELMQQIAEFSPAHISLLDHNEYLLYQAALSLHEKHPYLSRRLLLVDIRERDRVFQIMAQEKPDYVFHAAALKHVPLVESHPLEGVFTNVLGTRHVADACIASRVLGMVLISTDKAINPTSVMGATKRLAESYCQALDVLPQQNSMTRFITVRFGNVLGSTGSVVPLFQRQIEQRGPVTVTDPQMTRYFMTIREAVELILQAAFLGVQSEIQRGRVFVLDMGEPVSILELAENMIELSGLRPHQDVKIIFTGLRPGEKLTEELFHESEQLLKTPQPGIFVASPQVLTHKILRESFDRLEKQVFNQEVEGCLSYLRELVPEYQQIGHLNPLHVYNYASASSL